MNVEDLMKDNPEISGKKLEIISERQLGVALDGFVLKEQRQAINENVKEKLIRQHKRLIKRKRGEYKDKQEVGSAFMVNTTNAVGEVYVVEGDRLKERDETQDKGKIERRQAAANKANRYR